MLGVKPVLQIDGGLPNEVIGRDAVMVHDLDCQLVFDGECGRDLKQLPKEGVEVVGNIVLSVTELFLPNFDLDVGVRLEKRGKQERDRDREMWVSGKVGWGKGGGEGKGKTGVA